MVKFIKPGNGIIRSMRRGAIAPGTLIAALAMAILVSSVFFLLQDYGPESALRKFHRAVVNRDLADLRYVVSPGSSETALNQMAAMVDSYARAGARYQLLYVKRENRRVIAEVAYVMPNRGLVLPVFWVVEKSGARWRVDVDETLAVRRQMYGM